MFHDGIGAIQLQTAAGTSPADLKNINNGALSMAYPHAKTLAIKDACDMFGDIFGANLNRRDTVGYTMDAEIKVKAVSAETKRKLALIEAAPTLIDLDKFSEFAKESQELAEAFRIKKEDLTHHDQTVR